MCSPREATSVATRMGSRPSLKSCKILSRRFWSTPPVSARVSQPLRMSRSSRRRASSRVFEKIRIRSPPSRQEAQQQRELLVPADVEERLLDALGRLLLRHDRDLSRVVHELPG